MKQVHIYRLNCKLSIIVLLGLIVVSGQITAGGNGSKVLSPEECKRIGLELQKEERDQEAIRKAMRVHLDFLWEKTISEVPFISGSEGGEAVRTPTEIQRTLLAGLAEIYGKSYPDTKQALFYRDVLVPAQLAEQEALEA